ncbi:MAG: intradiol ring-cleavage dioxygenase [Acidobacteria bacterium]|nr:intradiol ring-cleavage dioxygenase [Acidobacteriota bacterium]
MSTPFHPARWSRRELLGGLSALYFTPGLFAEELYRTPRQTEGPFYPDHLPLDQDNDLIVVKDSTTPAVGCITHVTGRILTASGQPVRNAVVEIWQCDAGGAYLHTGSKRHADFDKNFQGFGRFETGSTGEYRFRTIRPVAYDNRTPHIHFAIDQGGKRMLTTQLYTKGEPLNAVDGVLKKVTDPKDRAALIHEYKPVPDSKIGELAVSFDIVIGMTPEDIKGDRFRGERQSG